MRIRRAVQTGALAVAAAAALLAWFWRQQAAAARADFAAAGAELAAAEGRDQAIRQKDAALASARPRSQAAAPAAAAPQKTPLQRLREEPKLQNQMLAVSHHRDAVQYAPFFEQLKLTPDQIRQFLDNEMKRMAALLDLRNTQEEEGLANSDPALFALRRQVRSDYVAAQTSLLGSEGFQQLQNFEQNAPAAAMAGNLAGTAAVAGTPLDSRQFGQLVAAIAAAQQSTRGDPYAAWPQVVAQAKTFLSPDQLELLATTERMGNTNSSGPFTMHLNALVNEYGAEDATAGQAPPP